MPLLTKSERRTLPHDAKVALRIARRLEKWPDTDGKPPWLVRAGGVLDEIADELEQVAEASLVVLKKLAIAGVKAAAAAALSSGKAKHEAAVEHVLEGAPEVAVDVASVLVWEAFKSLSDADLVE